MRSSMPCRHYVFLSAILAFTTAPFTDESVRLCAAETTAVDVVAPSVPIVLPGSDRRGAPGRRRVEAPLSVQANALSLLPFRVDVTAEDAALALSETDITPEIQELTRGLRSDPQLIYEFIRNHIDYVPVYGSVKGATMTLLDGCGNDFDQASLFVALVRAGGGTASFVHGRIRLNAQQITNWLGVDPIASVVGRLLASGGIPAQLYTSSGALAYVELDHVWAKAAINGSEYVFDPSFKEYSYDQGIALANAMGYNRATFLARATAGSTVDSDYVQDINTGNIRGDLVSMASNLIQYIRTTMPSATLNNVIGGRKIQTSEGEPFRTALPYEISRQYTWSSIPTSHKTYLRIQHLGIDQNLASSEIYGKRLTLFYNAVNRPELRLEGTILATGSPVAPGSYNWITLSADHPYVANGGTYCDEYMDFQIKAGGSYLVVNGWARTGRDVIERRRRVLQENTAAGGPQSSEPVLGETLNRIALNYLAETSRSEALIDLLASTQTLQHHSLGLCGQTGSPYIDMPLSLVSVISTKGNSAAEEASFFAQSGVNSAMEWGTIEQTQPWSAVSTVKLIDISNAQGDRLFDTTLDNWGIVSAQLRNYSTSELANVENYLAYGYRLVLPQDGNLGEGHWSGVGFLFLDPYGGLIGHMITGNLSGGYGTEPGMADAGMAGSSGQSANQESEHPQSAEPIDLVSGSYLYRRTDMAVGNGSFPLSLSFQRYYSSQSRLDDGALGRGWSHNFSITATTDSDPFQGMGEDSPVDAAASIAELLVVTDILQGAKTNTRLVVATVGHRWLMDQLINNLISVKEPGSSSQFARLPDGTYNPPPGRAEVLSRDPDQGFRLRHKPGDTLDFNVNGKLSAWTDPNGNTATLSYSGDRLQSVANGLGHSLTLTYAGARLSRVQDHSGRHVDYVCDEVGNLTSATDCGGHTTTYAYDLPGRLIRIYYPARPTEPFVTNVFDALDRVATQTDARGNSYLYYFSGYRAEELDPLGFSQVWSFDRWGKTIRLVDQLGHQMVFAYDGHHRLTKVVLPEGNSIEYSYDSNHNRTSSTKKPKPGSIAPSLVEQFGYEPTFNRLRTHTDPLGRVTTYTHDAKGNLLRIDQPEVGAATLQTRFTYNSRGQVLTVSDPEHRMTGYAYDVATGDLMSTTVDPGGLALTNRMAYDAVGNLTARTAPRGNTTTFAYDSMRRLTQVTTPAPYNYLTRWRYDPNGNLTTIERETRDPLAPWQTTTVTYTPTGKRRTVTDPLGHVTTYEHDNLDRLWKTIDAENHTTQYLYDPLGRAWRVIDALGHIVEEYTYSANGNKQSLKDANGNTTTCTYDAFDRLRRTTFPNASFEEYTSDAAGNIVLKRTRAGESLEFAYDALDRLVGKTARSAGGAVQYVFQYAYDRAGILTDAIDASGAIHHTYDPAGRLTTVVYPDGKTVGYTYDAAGNRDSLAYPDGYLVRYEHDSLNRLTAISTNSSPADFDGDHDVDRDDLGLFTQCASGPVMALRAGCDAEDLDHDGDVDQNDFGFWQRDFSGLQPVNAMLAEYTYDALSRRTALRYGNGTWVEYTYDQADRLTQLMNHVRPTDLSFTYTYDNVGNRLSMTTTDGTHGYGYDATYQLTSADYPASFFRRDTLYNYDPTGNRTTVAEGDVTTTYTTNNLNQYTAVNGVPYTYDANGNLASDGVNTYTYDPENRLVSAVTPQGVASYGYDPLGRRIRKTVNGASMWLLYDGNRALADYDADGQLAPRFVYGAGIDEPVLMLPAVSAAGRGYYHFDGLGSVSALTNSGGQLTEQYAYDAFGAPAPTGPLRDRCLFTGRDYDQETGLYSYRVRSYSAALGRFLQPDPAGYLPDRNLYRYVVNGPTNWVDPLGFARDLPGSSWDWNKPNWRPLDPAHQYSVYTINNWFGTSDPAGFILSHTFVAVRDDTTGMVVETYSWVVGDDPKRLGGFLPSQGLWEDPYKLQNMVGAAKSIALGPLWFLTAVPEGGGIDYVRALRKEVTAGADAARSYSFWALNNCKNAAGNLLGAAEERMIEDWAWGE